MSKKIYVASSWKIAHLLDPVHAEIRRQGMEPLDFRCNGHWTGSCDTFEGVQHFKFDFDLMKEADGCFAVLPAGESVCMEVGWFCGRGKPVVAWGKPRSPFDIMWLMVNEGGGSLFPEKPLNVAVWAMKVLLEG